MSNKIYTTIPAPKVPRNTFNRSRPNSLSMPFQRNVVVMAEEIYPGDLMKCNPELFARLQPMIAPVMNNMKISTHFFYVPLRTLNKHFSEFMFNNRTGDYNEVLPYVHTGTLYLLVETLSTEGKYSLAAEVIRLLDYIGLPFVYSSKTNAQTFVSSWLQDPWNVKVAGTDATTGDVSVSSGHRVNLAPFMAYQKIWSEYFRDENVEEDPFVLLEGGIGIDIFDLTGDQSLKFGVFIGNGYSQDVALLFQLRRRAWAHDRFTSALPFAQRGPDVLLPISGTAPVQYKDGYLAGDYGNHAGQIVFPIQSQTPGSAVEQKFPAYKPQSSSSYLGASGAQPVAQGSVWAYDPNGSLNVNFDEAALATTINDFRIAERVQRWFENDARGGVRPNEGTLAHFGIRTPDSTLDRAEFIGGSMQPIVVSEVAQTSESTADSPQGTLAGKGTSYNSNRGFRMFFTEHGFVFGICSALVRANYWQGIPKMFSRMQRDEYYWPEFANLGEEPVYTKEIYADATTVDEDDVFGYVPRYSDLKSAVGEVHGDMRSSLNFWTQTREFTNKPQLNREFLFGDPSLSPFAVQSYYSDPIIVTIQFHLKASRLMPFYGVPTL